MSDIIFGLTPQQIDTIRRAFAAFASDEEREAHTAIERSAKDAFNDTLFLRAWAADHDLIPANADLERLERNVRSALQGMLTATEPRSAYVKLHARGFRSGVETTARVVEDAIALTHAQIEING